MLASLRPQRLARERCDSREGGAGTPEALALHRLGHETFLHLTNHSQFCLLSCMPTFGPFRGRRRRRCHESGRFGRELGPTRDEDLPARRRGCTAIEMRSPPIPSRQREKSTPSGETRPPASRSAVGFDVLRQGVVGGGANVIASPGLLACAAQEMQPFGPGTLDSTCTTPS